MPSVLFGRDWSSRSEQRGPRIPGDLVTAILLLGRRGTHPPLAGSSCLDSQRTEPGVSRGSSGRASGRRRGSPHGFLERNTVHQNGPLRKLSLHRGEHSGRVEAVACGEAGLSRVVDVAQRIVGTQTAIVPRVAVAFSGSWVTTGRRARLPVSPHVMVQSFGILGPVPFATAPILFAHAA